MMLIDPRGILIAAGLTLGFQWIGSQDLCMPRHEAYGSVLRSCAELKGLISQGWIQ